MALYPMNPNVTQRIQTDIPGIVNTRRFVSQYHCTPAALDADRYVESTNMKVGSYTLAHTNPGDGLAHNVTVATTAVGAADTQGTITVAGTDLSGATISETITPVSGSTVQGTKAFATVTSIKIGRAHV